MNIAIFPSANLGLDSIDVVCWHYLLELAVTTGHSKSGFPVQFGGL